MTNRANNGITRRIVPCVLANVLLLAGTFGVPAQNEPLRSWNDGSVKQTIVDFGGEGQGAGADDDRQRQVADRTRLDRRPGNVH